MEGRLQKDLRLALQREEQQEREAEERVFDETLERLNREQ